MKDQFDVIVIGSGAGGAPIAHILAKAGKEVLVLEKGPLLRTQQQDSHGVSDFKRDELFATGAEKRIQVPGMSNVGQSYYSSHVEPDVNDEPHVYIGADNRDYVTLEGYTAQVIGGGTQLYGAVSLRFSENDFKLKSYNEGRSDIADDPNGDVKREARDWPISYNDLEAYYCKAEKLVGLNGTSANQVKRFSVDSYQTPLKPNPISQYVEVGMDTLKMPRYRTPLAVITEDHAPSGRKVPVNSDEVKTSYVNRYGDPLGFKSNTWVTLLAPIQDLPNLTILTNCVVTHLECSGEKITRVQYFDPSGKPRFASAKITVVACSAIESIRLLQLSARMDSEFNRRIYQNDLLGKYFLTHCFGGAETVVPGRFDKSESLDSDWASDFCATDTFIKSNRLWAGGAMYNNTSDQALPISLARTHGSQDIDTIWKAFVDDTSLTGQALQDWIDANFGTRLSVSFMANQVPLKSNRIELHPNVKDKWNRPVAYIIKDWHSHDRYLMNILAEQCAKVLRFGCDGGIGQYPIEGQGGVYMAENARARIANHILGGARFGTDRNDSVLDANCRAWDFDNLYVTDGAFMPTSGGANPTLTIQANSFRIADHLLTRL
ncbi:FAD-dependent oxidoreductase [Methylomonas lenta]|uniref:FAD-dependent oxidoreductase n=1 Tax=Methylomonas lenta TaxID=980561 RepID=A0A177MXI6_9GAMM|nr:GMC family oxidoreductase [Methylomonas lenta]OAI10331.1 FAD-dependent oxidoreductase [Methylomonas lenta]